MADIEKLCAEVAAFPGDVLFRSAQVVEVLVSGGTLVLIWLVVGQRRCRDLPIHLNLKIIFANVLALFCVHHVSVVLVNVGMQVAYFTYKDPCALLIPIWASIVYRGISIVCASCFPLWHLAITLERTWATVRASDYERSSASYGIICSIVVWSLALFNVGNIVRLALQDESFHDRTPYFTIITRTNAEFQIGVHFFFIGLELCSFAADYVLLVANRRSMNRVNPAYSLSRNYQLSENMAVTTRLVLPLDAVNAALFIVYFGIATVLRYLRSSVPLHTFHAVYEAIYPIFLLQGPLSILLYMRFAQRARQKVNVPPRETEIDMHFEQFRQQIA